MNTATPALPARASAAPFLIPALLACYLVWGSTYLAIRFALRGFPPFFQMGSRFLVAGVVLMAWVLWRNGRAAWPTARQWLHALVVGSLMLGGGMGLVTHAEMRISSGLVATFIAVTPLMVCGWGLLFGKRPSRLELLGMAVGLFGVVLLALAWLTGEAAPAWPPQAVPLLAWVYLVVFGSLIAFTAYMYLLAHASPALATSYAFVNPVIALLLGVALGGEYVTGGEWLATGVILLGVVLILLAKKKRLPEAASRR